MAVKTNREYQAMQHEIATAQSDLGSVEEKVLERMLEADDLNAASKRAEATLAAQSKRSRRKRRRSTRNSGRPRFPLKESTAARATLVKGARAPSGRAVRAGRQGPQGVAICTATRDGLCSVPRPPETARLSAGPAQRFHRPVREQRVLYWVPPPPPVEPPVVHAP